MTFPLMNRRAFLRLGSVGALAAGGAAYAAGVEPGWLKTTFKDVRGLGLDQRIRVLHLSDLHASGCVPWERIRESMEIGLSHKPDLVFLTGDFVTSTSYDVSRYAEALAPLKGHPHCYACLGNHDGRYRGADTETMARRLDAQFKKVGVKLLFNRSLNATVQGSAIRIAGVGDLWKHQVQPERCLTLLGKSKGLDRIPTLLLAHNPDTKEEVEHYHWDVMFSGHTHGGQVVVPIINWAPRLPVKDRSMVEGLYEWKGRHIHITRGVGSLHGLRFNCPPEVSLIDLV